MNNVQVTDIGQALLSIKSHLSLEDYTSFRRIKGIHNMLPPPTRMDSLNPSNGLRELSKLMANLALHESCHQLIIEGLRKRGPAQNNIDRCSMIRFEYNDIHNKPFDWLCTNIQTYILMVSLGYIQAGLSVHFQLASSCVHEFSALIAQTKDRLLESNTYGLIAECLYGLVITCGCGQDTNSITLIEKAPRDKFCLDFMPQLTPDVMSSSVAYTMNALVSFGAAGLFARYFRGVLLVISSHNAATLEVRDMFTGEEPQTNLSCDNAIATRSIIDKLSSTEIASTLSSMKTTDSQVYATKQSMELFTAISNAVKIQANRGLDVSCIRISFTLLLNDTGVKIKDNEEIIAKFVRELFGEHTMSPQCVGPLLRKITARGSQLAFSPEEMSEADFLRIIASRQHELMDASFFKKLWQSVWVLTTGVDTSRIWHSLINRLTSYISNGNKFAKGLYGIDAYIAPICIAT